jgi:hypothetical protein
VSSPGWQPLGIIDQKIEKKDSTPGADVTKKGNSYTIGSDFQPVSPPRWQPLTIIDRKIEKKDSTPGADVTKKE